MDETESHASTNQEKTKPIDLETGLQAATRYLGLENQTLMVSQARNFLKENKDLTTQVVRALRGAESEQQAMSKRVEFALAAEGLRLVEAPSLDPQNPARLRPKSGGGWEMHIDPKLRQDSEKFLLEAMHEYSAYWLIKNYRYDNPRDLPSAETADQSLVDRAGNRKNFSITHLIDATILQESGKLKPPSTT